MFTQGRQTVCLKWFPENSEKLERRSTGCHGIIDQDMPRVLGAREGWALKEL